MLTSRSASRKHRAAEHARDEARGCLQVILPARCKCSMQGMTAMNTRHHESILFVWPRSRVNRVKGREKPLTSAGDRGLVDRLGSGPDPAVFPPAHNHMKRSTHDVQHHPQHQTSPVPGERQEHSRRPARRARCTNASAATARHSRAEADRDAEPVLGRPRFESLSGEQVSQAVDLLSDLILAAERQAPVRAGAGGHGGESSGTRRQTAARRRRGSRLASGCTSGWQARRRGNAGAVAVSGGSRAPDCVGSSRSSRSS